MKYIYGAFDLFEIQKITLDLTCALINETEVLHFYRLFFKILVGIVLLLYSVSVMVMYLSPAARELLIYLHPCK